MDAWEILRANSTSPAGSDVWTLINTQNSGTGDGEETVCVQSIRFASYITETVIGYDVNTPAQSTLILDLDSEINLDNAILTNTEIKDNG